MLITEQDYGSWPRRRILSDKYEVPPRRSSTHYGFGLPLENHAGLGLAIHALVLRNRESLGWWCQRRRPAGPVVFPSLRRSSPGDGATSRSCCRCGSLPSDAHLEMIPMVTAFYQEPGIAGNSGRRCLSTMKRASPTPTSADYMKTFLERSAPTIQQSATPKNSPRT